jgi:hypothetical protein
MLGGWGGTWAQAFSSVQGAGSTTCTELWLVNSQTDSAFVGTFQRTGETVCPGAGSLRGVVLPDGSVKLSFGGGGANACTQTAGADEYVGVVSAAGGLTARRSYALHCEGAGFSRPIDFSVVATFAMNRR